MADWADYVLRPIADKRRSVDDVPAQERKLFDDVFRGFVSIRDTIDNIDLCQRFVCSGIPRRKDVRLDAYLTYHLTFYVQEIYILRERLEKYLKRARRHMLKVRGNDADLSGYSKASALVSRSLEGICNTRSSHVHDRPFSTQEIDSLSQLCFIAQFKPEFAEDAKLEYSFLRRRWKETLQNNRSEINTLLDQVFTFLFAEFTSSSYEALPNYSLKRTAANRLGVD